MKLYVFVFFSLVIISLYGCTLGDPIDIPNSMYYWFTPDVINNKPPQLEDYYSSVSEIGILMPDKIYLDFYSYVTITNIKVYKENKSINYSEREPVNVKVEVLLYDSFGNRSLNFSDVVYLNETVHSTNIEIGFIVSGLEVGIHRLVVNVYGSRCCVGEKKLFEKNVLVLRGNRYYISTIPITNSMYTPLDTIIYLYKKERFGYFKVAEDDNSGYWGVMAKIVKFLAPGEYMIKITSPNLVTSNNFAVYFGKTEIFSNENIFLDSNLTNTSFDTASILVEDVPTNTFLRQDLVERWFKFIIPE